MYSNYNYVLLLKYRVVRQLWIIRKPLETSGNRPRWFTAGFQYVSEFFINKKKFEKKYILIKKSETAAGFRRFPVGSRIIHQWRPHGISWLKQFRAKIS